MHAHVRLLSPRRNVFTKAELSDPALASASRNKAGHQNVVFYFNCYLLPTHFFFFHPQSKSRKNSGQVDSKTIAFQIEVPAECVQFLNLTSVFPTHISEKKQKNKTERESAGRKKRQTSLRKRDRPFEYVFSVYH